MLISLVSDDDVVGIWALIEIIMDCALSNRTMTGWTTSWQCWRKKRLRLIKLQSRCWRPGALRESRIRCALNRPSYLLQNPSIQALPGETASSKCLDSSMLVASMFVVQSGTIRLHPSTCSSFAFRVLACLGVDYSRILRDQQHEDVCDSGFSDQPRCPGGGCCARFGHGGNQRLHFLSQFPDCCDSTRQRTCAGLT